MLKGALRAARRCFAKSFNYGGIQRFASNKVIGIDLGTTFSCVAVMEGDSPRVIENMEGARTTPSYVGFDSEGGIIVGELAKRQAITNPQNTVYAAKRLIGRKFEEAEIQEDRGLVSYEIVGHQNGDAWVKVGDKEMSPSQIAAYILMKMKETAEAYLGEEVEKAVVTVPAYFNNQQKQATKDAGVIAGLDVLRIINEPTAAAMAYGLNTKDNSRDGIVVVFDLGGGTFDVSILDIDTGVFEVRATNGDTHLGGEDFDQKLVQFLLREFEMTEGIDLSSDPLAIQRIKEASENAKIELSSTLETVVSIPFIASDDTGPKNLNIKVTRAKFESLCKDLIERTVQPCLTCLKDAGVAPKDVAEVVLVGGMTRMPRVVEICTETFGKPPCKGVNPDEVVACGAAIQGAVLAGDVQDVVVIDTAPLSLGIETVGGVFTRMIPKNTNIPCERHENFTTAGDNQTSVGIRVFQGEREIAEHNKLLGEFQLVGIPPAPKGVPQIVVTFDIDANGIVNVSAKDKATAKEQQITIESKSGLTEEEIKRMEEDAKIHAEEDQMRKDLVNMRNEADSTIGIAEQTLEKMGDDCHKDLRETVEKEIEAMKKVLTESEVTHDLGTVKEQLDELKKAQFKLSEEFYQFEAKKRETQETEREKEEEKSEEEEEEKEEEKEDE